MVSNQNALTRTRNAKMGFFMNYSFRPYDLQPCGEEWISTLLQPGGDLTRKLGTGRPKLRSFTTIVFWCHLSSDQSSVAVLSQLLARRPGTPCQKM